MENKKPCDNGYCPFGDYDTWDCYVICDKHWADETELDYEDLLLEQQEQM